MEFARFYGDGKAVLAAMEFASVGRSEHAGPTNENLGGSRDDSHEMMAAGWSIGRQGQPELESACDGLEGEEWDGGDVADDSCSATDSGEEDGLDEMEDGLSDDDQIYHADTGIMGKQKRSPDGRHLVWNGLAESGPIIVPALGMEFAADTEAYTLWKLYGSRMGFGVQKRGSQKIDEIVYRSTFICSRGRTPRPQHMRKKLKNRIDPVTEKPFKTKRRGIHSTNCQARLVVSDRMLKNKWKVDFVHLEHNHKLSDPSNVKFFRCHRELPDWVKKQLDINDLAGVPQKHSFKSVVAQSGGIDRCSWITRDMYNHNFATRASNRGDGDASCLVKFFKKRQGKNPDFFYEICYDEDDRLKRVFWADARCRAAYRYFGDVISFDTTYLTNKYGMPFSPFVGVNQHGQTVLLGCALLNDETTETYTWLLHTWLTCMDGRQPRGIITDQCYAMQRAIQEVLPETRHRLCLWHIMKKLPSKIGQAQSRQHILPWAQQVVYNSSTEHEFEQGWSAIIEEYPETDKRREWFACMFDIRHKWIPVFLNKNFWAGMSTTQRSESINSFFDGFVTGGTSIHVFAWQYAQACRARLQSEKEADFRNYHETPVLISNHLFEHQLSRLYTTAMLYVFQAEVKQLVNINSTLRSSQANIANYTVTESRPIFYADDGSDTIIPGRVVTTTVTVDTRSGTYKCPCNMVLFKGIVCRHALSVYVLMGRTYIPGEYVLSRWCNDQHRTDELDALVPGLDEVEYVGAQQIYTSSHGQLLEIVAVCGTNNKLGALLADGLGRLKEEIIQAKEAITEEEQLGQRDHDPEMVVKDPVRANPVGRPRSARLKALYEPCKSKKRTTPYNRQIPRARNNAMSEGKQNGYQCAAASSSQAKYSKTVPQQGSSPSMTLPPHESTLHPEVTLPTNQTDLIATEHNISHTNLLLSFQMHPPYN